MSATITDVIFDYCDVLLDWRPRIPLEGQYPPGVIDMFFSADDPHGFRYYDRLSDSGWDESASWPITRSSTGRPWPGCSASTSSGNGLALAGLQPGMGELLRELDASGVRLWGLTNFTTKYVRAAHELFPELNLLRDTVVSSEEGILKPDPEIYRRAIARFGVDPAATLFVDDKPANVEAARGLGLNGEVFGGVDRLRRSHYLDVS